MRKAGTHRLRYVVFPDGKTGYVCQKCGIIHQKSKGGITVMEGKKFSEIYGTEDAEKLDAYEGVELEITGFLLSDGEDFTTARIWANTEKQEGFLLSTTSEVVVKQLRAIQEQLPVIATPQRRKSSRSRYQYLTLT